MVAANWVAPATDLTAAAEARARVAVVAIEMGYGHLRPARSLARELHTELLHTDRRSRTRKSNGAGKRRGACTSQ